MCSKKLCKEAIDNGLKINILILDRNKNMFAIIKCFWYATVPILMKVKTIYFLESNNHSNLIIVALKPKFATDKTIEEMSEKFVMINVQVRNLYFI